MIRLPGDEDRISIIGKTGSGKTIAGLAHLSVRSYTSQPWIIYNFKGDKNINAIRRARPLQLPMVPDQPGLYVVRPRWDEIELLNQHFRAIWERGRVGLYVDEGYMIGSRNEWFRTILTQGRSLEIPTIMLMQRPVFVDRFLLSESEFYQIFQLNDKKDRKIVEEYLPDSVDISRRLPRFHSYYYDSSEDTFTTLKPVPAIQDILQVFDERLARLDEEELRQQNVIPLDMVPVRKVRVI